ncbi:MAG: DUF748 domain-containing protein [Zoogloea sp.]|uniref:DUF748 domain-containing protein n=1 Tax=Zoogloea sp. TaxID=49181 RepID=UPI00262D078D|nr:DUF748 domain-containing protein [Zoogloea sp.]MDD3326419.1 DUF748 domain-containing protein [Zoogloea sp.]
MKQTTQPGASPDKAIGSRWRRRALWGAGVVALVGVAGFLVAPPLVKSVAESQLTELLHRPVSIEGVSINPYALSAEVRGLRVLEREGGATALSFASLYANVELESVFRGGAVVQEVKLVEPMLSVARLEGQRYNWSDVIDEMLAKPDDGSKSSFAVHNIRIEKGRIEFDDRPAGLKHVVADLELGVPFVSNLPSQVETFVEPLLAMKVNDTPFEIRGKAKPFAADRESVVDLKFEGFDLTRYLAYLPVEKTFRLPSARLSSSLEASFEQPPGGAPALNIKGGVSLEAVEVQHADGAPAIKLPSLKVAIDRLAPLTKEVAIASVTLDKPEVTVSRERDGRLSLLSLIPKPAAAPAPAVGKPDEKPAAPALTLGEFKIDGGRIDFTDHLAAGPFHKIIQDFKVSLRKLALPAAAPAELDFGFSTDAGEQLTHQGTLGLAPLKAAGLLELSGLDLPAHKLYLAATMKEAELLSGKVDGRVAYDFAQEATGPAVKLKAERLALKDLGLRLKGEKTDLVRLGLLELRDTAVDTTARKLAIGEVNGKATRVVLIRAADGLFNAQRLAGAPEGKPAASRPAGKPAAKPADSGPPWLVEVRHVALDDWGLRVEDRTLAPAIVFNAEPLMLRVDGLSTAKGSKAKLDLHAGINKRGQFGVKGTLGLAPLAGNLDLDLKAVDITMLQPYVTEKVKIAITRGKLTSRGKLAFELPASGGPKGAFKGSVTLGDFASVDKLNATDFLKWKSLYFGGVDVRLAPLAVSIDDIALTDFYTRLILDAQGGLNIREITAQRANEAKAAADAAKANGTVPAKEPEKPAGKADGQAVAKAEPPPPVRIKRITLQGGNIAYSDRFIKPNYDANLTGMGGRLTGLSSDPNTIAELDLRGKVDNSAPLEIVGKLNPFRQDRALDIRASVKDFELSSVSTYAAKYVGYGIDKGKLSAQLGYKIEDRKLSATNQVFLDQLTFGDKVDSPSALKLPVLLAVSLLKNSRGEIDLDLPVGGSLDDPQFSVGGIVVKVIVNLITKAITSPFALLGSIFGGNAEELAWLDFEPGFARLGPGADDKLKSIAKVMADKPGLKLEIAGRVDPATDREGLLRATLLGKVEALKVKDMAKRGESLGDDGRVTVSPAEYPALLTRVYKDEKFPKPRNVIGLAKDLPVAEMEKLILANTKVGDEDVRLLGQQRAQAVKNWLLEKGQVPAERVFVLSTHEGDDGKQPKARISRVDFSLR